MAKKLTIGSNEVTVPEKTDIATQISTAISGKLDKVTTTGSAQVYVKDNLGNQGMNTFGGDVNAGWIVQRNSQGLIRIKSGNKASRPTTNLNNGDQYFNTDTKQMEVYIGDANHWLYQKYGEGDTLPTPAVGKVHQYMIIFDENTVGVDIYLGGAGVYESTTTTINGSMVFVRNVGGTISVTNNARIDFQTVTTLIIEDSDKMKLMRVA